MAPIYSPGPVLTTERAAYTFLVVATLAVVVIFLVLANESIATPKTLGGPPFCAGLEGQVPDRPAP